MRILLKPKQTKIALPAIPMVDYSHVAYQLDSSRKVGKVTYVDFTSEGTVLYVSDSKRTTVVHQHQVINTFGVVR